MKLGFLAILAVIVAAVGVVFENPQHDFPQRVGYQRSGKDLLAWIEGTRDGGVRRIEFPYRRAACAGDLPGSEARRR